MTESRFIPRLGLEVKLLDDLYHFFLHTSWLRVIAIVLGTYLAANVIFATAYWLDAGGIENARPGSFSDAFFFSVQTMATIGYGKLVPRSVFANILVTAEALTGLVGFAVVTGLIFSKFARLTARVMFSNVACVAMRDGTPSMLFRLANIRANQVVEAEIKLHVSRTERTAEGEQIRRFYDVPVIRSHNAIFSLTWTVVAPLVPGSPLYGTTPEILAAWDAEFIASLVGIDSTTSQTVHAQHSYLHNELKWDHRFVDILIPIGENRRAIDYNKFHDTVAVDERYRMVQPSPPTAGLN